MLSFLTPLFLSLQVGAVESQQVFIQLKEFTVQAEPRTIKAGSVKFVAANKGLEEHELVVRKKEQMSFKELGEIEPFAPRMTKEMTLELQPGIYELSCQIIEKEEGKTVDHYKKGMRTEIEVK